MPDADTTRVCECGELYDFLTRGVEGGFHFRVQRVGEGEDGALDLVGHWRSGVVDPASDLLLFRADGATVQIASLQVQPPVSEAAERRGQRVLTVRTPHPESVHANSCVRRACA